MPINGKTKLSVRTTHSQDDGLFESVSKDYNYRTYDQMQISIWATHPGIRDETEAFGQFEPDDVSEPIDICLKPSRSVGGWGLERDGCKFRNGTKFQCAGIYYGPFAGATENTTHYQGWNIPYDTNKNGDLKKDGSLVENLQSEPGKFKYWGSSNDIGALNPTNEDEPQHDGESIWTVDLSKPYYPAPSDYIGKLRVWMETHNQWPQEDDLWGIFGLTVKLVDSGVYIYEEDSKERYYKKGNEREILKPIVVYTKELNPHNSDKNYAFIKQLHSLDWGMECDLSTEYISHDSSPSCRTLPRSRP